MNVLCIGGGALGSVLSSSIERAGKHSVSIWDTDSLRCKGAVNIEQADAVLLCVPSWSMRELAVMLSGASKGAVFISFSKGIEKKTRKRVDQVLADIVPNGSPFALVSGPMLADELLAGLSGAASVATTSQDAFSVVTEVFDKTPLILSYSNDFPGVSLCGVLKNVYALMFGISDGLGLGSNARGILFTEALEESARIVDSFGGNRETVLSYAFVGDLMATGTSSLSRNYSYGFRVGAQGICQGACEGVASHSGLDSILGDSQDYRLFSLLGSVLSGACPAREAFNHHFQSLHLQTI